MTILTTRLRSALRRVMPRSGRNAVILAVAAVAASIEAPRVAQTRLEEIPGAMTSAGIEVASAPGALVRTVTGRHLGFDTSDYPGDDAMAAWREAGPYEWVGYYLPAPCHKDDGWSGKRQTLQQMGWGMAVIYVGQQTWGHVPGKPTVETRYVKRRVRRYYTKHGRRHYHYVTKRVPVRVVVQPRAKPGQSCGTQLVSGARGVTEARDAIARTVAEGFPKGTTIFLDVEYMDAVPSRMRDYYKAWVKTVLADGRYHPGIYAHTHNAKLVYDDVKASYAAAGLSEEPPFWVAGGSDFAPDKAPHEVGHAFAAVWQGILDKVETHSGIELPIDVNVAAVPSPSSALYAQGE